MQTGIPITQPNLLTGLASDEVRQARMRYGRNVLAPTQSNTGWRLVLDAVTEPMFGLLMVACLLYILLGQWQEGIVLAIAMAFVAGISVFQSVRSERALQALRQLTQPTVSVLRDGQLTTVATEDLVVGDLIRLIEGETVPADGQLEQGNDCAVDESVLTGESVSVIKTAAGSDLLWAGTLLVSGSAYMRLTAVGEATELGRLGVSLQQVETEKTPLLQQINQFIRRMAIGGFAAFLVVWAINFARSGDWISSLLLGLTIAMSVLPEEIPVAFSSFMVLGAARMARFGVLAKRPQTVETLGSATVICTDKTGTLTQEGMSLARLYDGKTQQLLSPDERLPASAHELVAFARWASESDPFDPMEKAIVATYQQLNPGSESDIRPIGYEYPLAGIPPMMTHVYAVSDAGAESGFMQVAGKGAVERIVRVCRLQEDQAAQVLQQAAELAREGYRVLGVAGSHWHSEPFPSEQDDFVWSFKGLVALENPPKPNARVVVQQFVEAGITVKMITGDSPETAQAIARQVALPNADQSLTGQQVEALTDEALREQVQQVNVFARMYPEAKLRVIRALKQAGEIVAMTGDGVNDGPALQAAHIGVAMGKRGTELAKQAASLVLVQDNLGAMVDAIAQGRRIYQNLKKAIGYIVSIHIPIILTVALPLLLNWRYINLFSPVHVIFLELVMGPTCSIAFENEPAEADLMKQRPRPLTDTFLTTGELGLRVTQGLLIALATLTVYYQAMQANATIGQTRTMTFVTLVLSNVFLTLVDRSERDSFIVSLGRPNPLLWFMLGLTLLMLGSMLLLPPVQTLAQFTPLTGGQLLKCLGLSIAGVGWIEGYKLWRRQFANQ